MSGWGVLTHVDAGPAAAESIAAAIELARAAESLGYESFWVAQHRFGHQGGVMPSPLILLAAVAQHTTRIRLGTASIAPAFEDPRRLLEDAAVLDALSGGRLELGLGSGSSPQASAAWGFEHESRHEWHWSAVDSVLDGIRSGIGHGERLPVVPSAAGLADRVWLTTGSAAGAQAAAARRAGLIVGRRTVDERGPRAEDRRVAELIEQYRQESGSNARVAISRPLLATTDGVLAGRLRDREQRLRGERGKPGAPASVLIGHPDDIVAGLRDDPARGLVDHLLIHTRPLTVPPRIEIAGLELLAERVRPEVGAIFHESPTAEIGG
ncbi:LLM class flavin-dependent oxidoreductase [Nocardia sp. NPDC024068]|uniref:LLM class flavin-dependent oxidoreductase n=1 Tax=Nocardia sp. NPDC024068 TaxID=3157197 RepID=UPI0033F8D73C